MNRAGRQTLIALRARRQAVQITREMAHPSIPAPRVLITPPPLAKQCGPVVLQYVEPAEERVMNARPYRAWKHRWFAVGGDPLWQWMAAGVVLFLAAASIYLNWIRR